MRPRTSAILAAARMACGLQPEEHVGKQLEDAQGPRASPMLAALLEAEASHERALASARAEAERIVAAARDQARHEDEALAQEADELQRGIQERLAAARSRELSSLAQEGRARSDAFTRLSRERAPALAGEIVRRLLKDGAP